MYIEDQNKFWEYINLNLDSKDNKKSHEDITKLINYYLFKIDGKAKERMWSFLKKIKKNNIIGI